MLREYTEQEHAKRLIEILELPGGPCDHCPACSTKYSIFDPRCPEIEEQWLTTGGEFITNNVIEYVCKTCIGFLGFELTTFIELVNGTPCPCCRGIDVIKASWLALEEKGYLE